MTTAAAPTFFATFIRDLWRGLVLPYVLLLRAITGRRRPDYALISKLELDCGLRELEPGENWMKTETIGGLRIMAGPRPIPRPRPKEPAPRRVQVIELEPKVMTRRPAKKSKWETDFERGYDNARAWIKSLD